MFKKIRNMRNLSNFKLSSQPIVMGRTDAQDFNSSLILTWLSLNFIDDIIPLHALHNICLMPIHITGSPTLGEIFNPAQDCPDIVDQLPEAKDGFYWIVLPKGTKHKVYITNEMNIPGIQP